MRKNTIIFLSSVIIIILSSLFVYFSFSKDMRTIKIPVPNSIGVGHSVQEDTVEIVSTYEHPIGYDLFIEFDPQKVQIKEISEGDLWVKSTTLLEKIDNNKGTVRFSTVVPIGGDTKKTGTIIAKVKFVKLKPDAVIKISNQSEIIFMGTGESKKLETSEIKL